MLINQIINKSNTFSYFLSFLFFFQNPDKQCNIEGCEKVELRKRLKLLGFEMNYVQNSESCYNDEKCEVTEPKECL